MIVDELKKSIYLSALKGELSKNRESDSCVSDVLNFTIEQKGIDNSEIKRRKITPDIQELYPIPKNWKWIKLGFLCDVIRGLTFSTSFKEPNDNNILVLRGGNIDSKTEKLIYDDNIYVNKNIPNDNQYLKVGDTLIVASSGTKTSVGKSAFIDEIDDCVSFGGFMMVVRAYSNILHPKYLSYNIKMYRNKIINDTNGYISNITNGILNNLLIPLPPIEEQQRIVAKIEELFSKLDEIKTIENELNNTKIEFPTDMRKSILYNAISGKLSKQLSTDTNVEITLNMLAKERKKYIEENNIKIFNKVVNKTCFTDDRYTLPRNWKYVSLQDISICIFSGNSPKYSKVANMNKIIGQKVNQEFGLQIEDMKFGIDEFFNSVPNYQYLQKNDVLLNSLGGGSVGRVGIIKDSISNTITDGHIFVIRTNNYTNEKYIYYFLKLYRKKLEDFSNGTTNQRFLTISQVNSIMIPLPPIEEQQRIVDKLEQLLPLCDDIEKIVNE